VCSSILFSFNAYFTFFLVNHTSFGKCEIIFVFLYQKFVIAVLLSLLLFYSSSHLLVCFVLIILPVIENTEKVRHRRPSLLRLARSVPTTTPETRIMGLTTRLVRFLVPVVGRRLLCC
jgi:hypothetical protein